MLDREFSDSQPLSGEVRQMGLMMPPRAGGAQGGEGGSGATSWVNT